MTDLDVSLGGVSLADTLSAAGGVLVVEDVDGRAVLPGGVELRSVPGAVGTVLNTTSLGERAISVSCALLAPSPVAVQSLARALSVWAVGPVGAGTVRAPQPLVFSDQAPLGYSALVRSYSLVEHPTWLEGEIEFVCPTPWLWGDEQTETVSLPSATFPALTNATAEPVIEVVLSAAASGSLVLLVNSVAWRYTGSIPAGAVLRIDSVRRETRLAGALKVAEVSGDYPLLVGLNTIGASSPGTAQVVYRARYL